VAQLPVLIVLAPAVIWLFATDATGVGTFLLVWTVLVSTSDNIIRPLLIKRGADLSLVLIFAGVVGGLLTLGIIGLFLGPVVLAVSWRLFAAWVDAKPLPTEVKS
jgi:predicted PurR-regulated permease PerM